MIWNIVILLAYNINFDGHIIVSLFGQTLECWNFQISVIESDQFLPVKEDNLDVDILAILMEEVFEKMRNGLIGDVTADDDVSRIEWKGVI